MWQKLHHACAQERFKLRGSEHFWKLKSPKFGPCLRAIAIWKSTLLKTGSPGALFEVEVAKICTTPACDDDLEVKIVENMRASDDFWKLKSPKFAPRLRVRASWNSKSLAPGARSTFGGSKCFSRGRQGFRHSILIKIAKAYCNSEVKRLVSQLVSQIVS